MFYDFVDRIEQWFGSGFSIGRFLPWLLFGLANLGLAAVEFHSLRIWLVATYADVGAGKQLLNVALALGAVAVLAYTLTPATRVVRALLEGRNWPFWIAAPFVLRQALYRDRLASRRAQLSKARDELPGPESMKERIWAARAKGSGRRLILDRKAIEIAEMALEGLTVRSLLNRSIPGEELSKAVTALCKALEKNCAEVSWIDPADEAGRAEAQRLHNAQAAMIGKLEPFARSAAQGQEWLVVDALDKYFAGAEIAPTRLGNEVAALRSYCETRYGFDFDFFWPRLKLVLKNDKMLKLLGEAEVQVDYAILVFSLSLALVLAWLPIMAAAGDSLLVFALVALVGPLVCFGALALVHENFRAYGALVRSVIDLNRFELVTELRRALPATGSAEKALWTETGKLLALNEGDIDPALVHPE